LAASHRQVNGQLGQKQSISALNGQLKQLLLARWRPSGLGHGEHFGSLLLAFHHSPDV